MIEVRSVEHADEFTVAPGEAPDYRENVARYWDDGEGRPAWTFVGLHAGRPVARVGYLVNDTVSNPTWLGTLPPQELTVFGLEAWGDDPAGEMEQVIRRSRELLGDALPETLEIAANPARHRNAQLRMSAAGALGLALFQEKEGVLWVDEGRSPEVPDRLRFLGLDEVGEAAYGEVMARICEGTLDRNDRYYYSHVGPEHWAAQMMVFADPGLRHLWMLAERAGQRVGYVAMTPFDDTGTATIAHIGVLPEHRGNGYVSDLLAAGTAAARGAGFSRILSDVDTLNQPMLAAMERAGHHAAATEWHVWNYRGRVR